MNPAQHPQRFAEFFAGIGLVRLGLETQGWQAAFANDIDPAKAELYRRNFADAEYLAVGDIHGLAPSQIPEVELFTASFPCNDLSIAGKWNGLAGKESSAFWGVIRLLEALPEDRRPLVLLENVVGFLLRHSGNDLRQALEALCGLGYRVDAFILNASHWVPQSRARLFIVAKPATDAERREFALECDCRPRGLARFIRENDDLAWDLRELPRLPKLKTRLDDILEDLPADNAHWWSAERADYFVNQLSDRHAAIAREMMAGDRWSSATAFRRVRNGRSMAELRIDGIAGCLRTPRGGSGRQILFQAGSGKYRVRLLTPRECARLQGVPDSYRIDVPLNQALFGFGDAVCVPVIEWIARHYLNPTLQSLRAARPAAIA